jgi:hypothetical protein
MGNNALLFFYARAHKKASQQQKNTLQMTARITHPIINFAIQDQ